jgi:hypothetical protein
MMIDKKLEKLGIYAENLENEEPVELLVRYFNQNEDELKTPQDTQLEFGKDFGNKVVQVINNYKDKGLPDTMISCHLFSIFVSFIKKSMIEQKANLLEIDRTLYKQEMRLLFKGKWK